MRYDSSVGADATKVEQIIKLAREEYGLLSMTDIVLNHTANDSPWLHQHPEAGSSLLLCTTCLFVYLCRV